MLHITACASLESDSTTTQPTSSDVAVSMVSDSSTAETSIPDESMPSALTALTEPTEATEPEKPLITNDEDLVLISDYASDILLDIKYATTDNFTGQVIYQSADAYIRYGTLKKLMKAQDALNKCGYGLKIWDAYRPAEAQWKLWEVCPNAKFVADPRNGYSNHTRGNTVDVTLVTYGGEDVEMPSQFDEFGATANRNYKDVSPEKAEHALLLETIMEKCGFKGYKNEWWHFTDKTSYPVIPCA